MSEVHYVLRIEARIEHIAGALRHRMQIQIGAAGANRVNQLVKSNALVLQQCHGAHSRMEPIK